MRFNTLTIAACTLGVVALSFGTGCVSTEETSEDPDAFGNLASFCEAQAKVQCQNAVVKACRNSDDASLSDDRAACIKSRKSTGTCNPNNYEYNKSGAQLCIDTQKSAYEDATITTNEAASIARGCDDALNGGGSQGQACTINADCDVAGGLACVKKGGSNDGVCIVPEAVTAGASCSANNAQCPDGFYCGVGTPTVCIQKWAAGENCDSDNPCQDGLVCSNPTNGGVCFAKGENGDACTGGDDCTSGFCTIASGQTNGECTATLIFQSTAKSCDTF